MWPLVVTNGDLVVTVLSVQVLRAHWQVFVCKCIMGRVFARMARVHIARPVPVLACWDPARIVWANEVVVVGFEAKGRFFLFEVTHCMQDASCCRNCAGCDFVVDPRSGTTVCEECGCVDDEHLPVVAVANYRDVFAADGHLRHDAQRSEHVELHAYHLDVRDRVDAKRSAPYRRQTYFSERISQWREREPEIPSDDLCEIDAEYQRRWGNERGHVLTKEECRTMLAAIDAYQPTRAGKIFVKKYLVSVYCRTHGGLCVHTSTM